jgi:hypothetical protein
MEAIMDAVGGSAERESKGGVIGVALGLLALLGALAALLPRPTPDIDGAARLAELFGPNGPPLGLSLAEASAFSDGRTALRLTRAAHGAGFEEVLLVRYPRLEQANAQLEGLAVTREERERSLRKAEAWQRDPEDSWRATLDASDVAWGHYRADVVIQRAYEAGGSWRDLARVNLATKQEPLVLCAFWPEKVAASKEALEPLLGALRLPEPPERVPR